jgi:hypothetical protein
MDTEKTAIGAGELTRGSEPSRPTAGSGLWTVFHSDGDEAGLMSRKFATEAEARAKCDEWNRAYSGHVVIPPNAPDEARVPAWLEAGRSECDWCLRKVGTHVFTNDIGDRFLCRNAHKDGRGNECLHSFAIIEELPNAALTGGEAVPTNGVVGGLNEHT